MRHPWIVKHCVTKGVNEERKEHLGARIQVQNHHDQDIYVDDFAFF